MEPSRLSAPTFEPTVTVLASAPAVLAPPDLTYASLRGRFPGLDAAQAVCWTGSTAAGWGNALSDIDLYAFADVEIELPCDDTSETWPRDDRSGVRWSNWMGRYGDACVDLKIWPLDALEAILAPYRSTDEPESCGLSDDMQDFIYRVSIAVALRDDDAFFVRARSAILDSCYNRALARRLKILAENQLNDVAGQLQSGDVSSARLSATLAASTTADHCLLLAGDLCRRPKWLMRRLKARPECGITVEEYRQVVLNGQRPDESEKDCAVRTARWAQEHLVRVEPLALSSR